jgi:hypothetical protein
MTKPSLVIIDIIRFLRFLSGWTPKDLNMREAVQTGARNDYHYHFSEVSLFLKYDQLSYIVKSIFPCVNLTGFLLHTY